MIGESKWKAFIEGKKYGPVDEDTIQRWIKEEKVNARTQLWCPGMTAWTRAAEVKEFAPCFEATVALIPALEEEPAPAPKPAPAPVAPAAPAPRPARPLVDHDAPTVIAESPFAGEAPARPAPRPRPAVVVRPEAAAPAASVAAPPPRPSLPLLPILFSLLALLPAAAMVLILVVLGDISTLPVLDFALLGGTAFGLLLLIVLPLFYNGLGLVGGLLGALVAFGCWVAVLVKEFLSVDTDIATFFQTRFLDGFSAGGFDLPLIATLLNWLALVVPFLALLYYAFSRKYRARIA